MYRIASWTACCILALGVTAFAGTSVTADQATLEKSFDANINPDNLRDWMKLMAAEPNHLGSPHDK
jgi:N-acetylated-alpha-linked acidic dipeptidase